MSALRGFGLQLDTTTGRTRNWYVDGDGYKRWVDTGELVPGQVMTGNDDLVPARHATLGTPA